MAFFEFLVRGADVSVFHGSEWCGPCSLEFLAGRSEALIYQDVLSVRCVHGGGNSDNSAHTHTCAHTIRWSSFTQDTGSGSVRKDVWLHVHTSSAPYAGWNYLLWLIVTGLVIGLVIFMANHNSSSHLIKRKRMRTGGNGRSAEVSKRRENSINGLAQG